MSSVRHLALALVLALPACFPTPGPVAPAAGSPSEHPEIIASCQQTLATVEPECARALDPKLSREDARAAVDAYQQILAGLTYCSVEVKAPLTQCVANHEAALPTWDPEADARRAAAEPRATATRATVDYRSMATEYAAAAQHARLMCEHKDAGPASARACVEANDDFAAAQDELRDYLLAAGFDARDLKVLGLWPSV